MATLEPEEWLKAFLQMDGATVENNQILTARPPTPQQRTPHQYRYEPISPVGEGYTANEKNSDIGWHVSLLL